MAVRPTLFGRALSALRVAEPRQSPTPLRQASPSDERDRVSGADLNAMYSRAYEGSFLGQAWLDQLAQNADTVLQKEGAHDLKLFDALLDDDTAKTALDQRALAVTERPWKVEPGNAEDPRSVKAADELRAMVNTIGWDRCTRLMLFAKWYGYAVAEGIYEMREHDGRWIVWLRDIVVPDRAWFAFTNAGELRMKDHGEAEGLAVPPNKFWSWRTGATHDFAHYGTGLAHWCYWPIWFKRNGLQFWALYLEKYGQPTVAVPYVPGSDGKARAAALDIGRAVGVDSAIAFPAIPVPGAAEGSSDWLKPFILEATRSGGADGYPQFKESMDDALRSVIIGQPGTSSRMSTGLGSGQSEAHEDVAETVARSDSDELAESFNSTFPTWLTRWNHGPDVAPPRLFRQFDEEEDLDTIADRDAKLDKLGWRRTDDSFAEVYGDGYERKPDPIVTARPGAIDPRTGRPVSVAGNDNRAPGDQRTAVFAAGDPRPLYISRRLTPGSARALLKWAEGAGFVNLVDAAELHATVCYSRAPVDWFDMPEDYFSDQDGGLTVRKSGPRAVELFGDKAIVLMFASRDMKWRHESLEEAGASHDWSDFRPHVTFAKGEQPVDLEAVEPFTGELRFGPELWETLDANPVPDAVAFSAAELDQVDRLTAELAADLEAEVSDIAEAIRARVAQFEAQGPLSKEGLRLALLQAAERGQAFDGIARALALPFAAEHAAAAVGAEDSLTA